MMQYSVKGFLRITDESVVRKVTNTYTTVMNRVTFQPWGVVDFEIQLNTNIDRESLFEKLKQAVDKYGGYIAAYEADGGAFNLVYKYPAAVG